MMRNKSEVLKRIKLAILGYLAKAVERQNGPKWPKMAHLEADFTETTQIKGKNGHCSFSPIWLLVIVVTDQKKTLLYSTKFSSSSSWFYFFRTIPKV